MMGAWAGWLEYSDLQQEKRDKLAAAISFWTHKELASAFAEFRLNVLEQKAVRLSLLHWQHTNLSKVFQRWKEYKARRAGLFGALIALACKWEQPLMEDAFAAWQDFTAERKRIKVVMPLFGFAKCVLAISTVSFCMNGCAMPDSTGVAFLPACFVQYILCVVPMYGQRDPCCCSASNAELQNIAPVASCARMLWRPHQMKGQSLTSEGPQSRQ